MQLSQDTQTLAANNGLVVTVAPQQSDSSYDDHIVILKGCTNLKGIKEGVAAYKAEHGIDDEDFVWQPIKRRGHKGFAYYTIRDVMELGWGVFNRENTKRAKNSLQRQIKKYLAALDGSIYEVSVSIDPQGKHSDLTGLLERIYYQQTREVAYGDMDEVAEQLINKATELVANHRRLTKK